MSDYFLNKIYDSLLSNKPVPKKPEPIVEKKETFKPLSKVYEVLVREAEHVAVYGSKEDVNPNNIPDRTSQGLETLGVVSKEIADRWRRQAGLETANVVPQIKNLIKQNNINDNKQKVFKEFYSVLEASNIDVNALLQIINDPKTPGTFNAFESEQYNCVTAAIQSIQTHPIAQEKPFNSDDLRAMLANTLPLAPQFASTNVGPGEFYFSMFSNATVAGGEGSKSGDLQLGNESIEVKATDKTGARLGGTDQVRNGYTYILQHLNSKYEFLPGSETAKLKALNDIVKFIHDEKEAVANNQKTPEQAYIDLKNDVTRLTKTYHRIGELNPDNRITNKFANPDIKSISTLVTSGGKLGKTKRTFVEYFENYITNIITATEQQKEKFSKITREEKYLAEGRLDQFLYGVLAALQNRPDITTETIIKFISSVNNYSPSYVEKDLQELFGNLTPEQIFTKYEDVGTLNKLVGAMHLLSYTKEIKCTKYLFVNSGTGETLVVNAPNDLKEALTIVSKPGMYVDTSFDRPEGSKTARAKSVNVEYYG